MRAINVITLLLIIIGGINWLLVGAFDLDLVSAIFGTGSEETAPSSTVSRVIYILVGLAALLQLFPLSRMMSNSTHLR